MNRIYPIWKRDSRLCIGVIALGISALMTACNSGQDASSDPGPVQPSGINQFPIKHIHMASAGFQAEVLNDLPDSLVIRLNSLPGKMGGNPQNEYEFIQRMRAGSELRVPWDSLIAGGHMGTPLIYSDSPTVFAITPASRRMMRIGTFAETLNSEDVFGGGQLESYGFYSMKLQTNVMAVYFDGPAELKGLPTLCDGAATFTDASIPKAGIYWFASIVSGNQFRISLVPDPGDLVFAVVTQSDAHLDFIQTLMESLNCTALKSFNSTWAF